MPRNYSRTRISSYDDPDLEELSADAQWLYFRVLLPNPALSAAGVVPWKPKHWVRKAADMTLERLIAAAAELEQARMILVDTGTEECLVRSYVRGDEVLRNPRTSVAVVKAWSALGSRPLQAALVTEVVRVHRESPEFSSWTHKDSRDGMARIMSRPGLDTVGYAFALTASADRPEVPIADVDPVDFGVRDGVPIGNADRVDNGVSDPGPDYQSTSADYQSSSARNPCKPLAFSLTPDGGYPVGVPHLSGPLAEASTPLEAPEPDPDDTPPRGCRTHPDGTSAACRDCRDTRLARERAQADAARAAKAQRSADANDRAEDRVRAAAKCSMCRGTGYRGQTVCHHDPGQDEVNRTGMAQVRAELDKRHLRLVTGPEQAAS